MVLTWVVAYTCYRRELGAGLFIVEVGVCVEKINHQPIESSYKGGVSMKRILMQLLTLAAILLVIYDSWSCATPSRRQQHILQKSHSSSISLINFSKQTSALSISSLLCLIPLEMVGSPTFAADPVAPLVWKSGKNPVVQNKNDPKEVCICTCFDMFFLLCIFADYKLH